MPQNPTTLWDETQDLEGAQIVRAQAAGQSQYALTSFACSCRVSLETRSSWSWLGTWSSPQPLKSTTVDFFRFHRAPPPTSPAAPHLGWVLPSTL